MGRQTEKDDQKLKLTALVLLVPLTACSQVNEWHSFHPTVSQRDSKSYKFLISKFGANNIETECDAEEASINGEEYLFQIMGEGPDIIVGETIGHGRTLQEALDNAADNYLSPQHIKDLRQDSDQREAERAKREAELKKKCCK